jgi:hypothetical protein
LAEICQCRQHPGSQLGFHNPDQIVKNNLLAVLGILAVLFLPTGCATTGTLGSMTSAQAVLIAQPLVSAGLSLVLRNNPSYIPVATKVGTDLSTANWADLTTSGINAVVAASVAKAGGDPATTAILSSALDAGLVAYLEAVGESALAKDPNAQTVLQDLGSAIGTAATIATANPKAFLGPVTLRPIVRYTPAPQSPFPAYSLAP